MGDEKIREIGRVNIGRLAQEEEEEEEEILLVEDEGVQKGACPFVPHKFELKVAMDVGFPKILIGPQAYSDMVILVEKSAKMNVELGWLGLVNQVPDSVDLHISKIILPQQECHICETRITADGIFKVYESLRKRNGKDLLSTLRFWGHSHIGSPTNPSNQDIKQIDYFRKSGCDFFLRGIANDQGRIEFSLFLFKLGIALYDVEWRLFVDESPSRRSFWDKEISQNVERTSRSWDEMIIYDPPRIKSGYRSSYQSWKDGEPDSMWGRE